VDHHACRRRRAAAEGGDLLLTDGAATALEQSTPLAGLDGLVDSVYFLMFDGWPERLESNRWHWARRWARQLPVTLIQPRDHGTRSARAEPGAGIANCEIVAITNPDAPYPLRGLVQAGQVLQHMRERGHARPLLWSYNPRLAGLSAALPAVARVHHATENYFDFADLSDGFYRELEASLLISDVVIAVSRGVAEGIHSRVPDAGLAVVTNGCDTTQYGPTGAGSTRIEAERERFARVASFAGTINERLDFELIGRAAAANDTTLLVFAGPVSPLTKEDSEAWRRVLSLDNVLHLERIEAAEMAALYRSSDLGFIPYRRERLLVRNGFPLKTLEMAATGLPVVSSHMEPIVGLASAIAVAEDDKQFLSSFASRSRSTLTDAERHELLEVAAANDYDRKFEQVVASLADVLPVGRGAHTRLDDLLLDLGYEPWVASCARIFERLGATPLLTFATVPRSIRRLVSRRLKDHARGLRVP
jgi:glycosyltransferase involved in cell wall biosynthesis